MRHFTICFVLAIVTGISYQSTALSFEFKNPTHPTLSEVTATDSMTKSESMPTASQQQENSTQLRAPESIKVDRATEQSTSSSPRFKNPTHPTLSEVTQS